MPQFSLAINNDCLSRIKSIHIQKNRSWCDQFKEFGAQNKFAATFRYITDVDVIAAQRTNTVTIRVQINRPLFCCLGEFLLIKEDV